MDCTGSGWFVFWGSLGYLMVRKVEEAIKKGWLGLFLGISYGTYHTTGHHWIRLAMGQRVGRHQDARVHKWKHFAPG